MLIELIQNSYKPLKLYWFFLDVQFNLKLMFLNTESSYYLLLDSLYYIKFNKQLKKCLDCLIQT